MTLAQIRAKWDQRYAARVAEGLVLEPNPLVTRFRDRIRGGWMLDAACGLGSGIAGAVDRVDRAVGVDLSGRALRAARQQWGAHPKITWLQADVAAMPWKPGCFALVCAFGFTDWNFLRKVPQLLRPGGLFLYQGFAERQLAVKPNLDPAWTSTPQRVAALSGQWQVLTAEESDTAPYRVSFAALRPESES